MASVNVPEIILEEYGFENIIETVYDALPVTTPTKTFGFANPNGKSNFLIKMNLLDLINE